MIPTIRVTAVKGARDVPTRGFGQRPRERLTCWGGADVVFRVDRYPWERESCRLRFSFLSSACPNLRDAARDVPTMGFDLPRVRASRIVQMHSLFGEVLSIDQSPPLPEASSGSP